MFANVSITHTLHSQSPLAQQVEGHAALAVRCFLAGTLATVPPADGSSGAHSDHSPDKSVCVKDAEKKECNNCSLCTSYINKYIYILINPTHKASSLWLIKL